MSSTRKAVFLDRDGVINVLVPRDRGLYSPRNIDEFELFPWTSRALSRLADNGYELVVVTNQPDIARGLLEISELEKMHQKLCALTPIEHIYICSHDSSDHCDCRKPRPGLLLRAARDLKLDLGTSWTIGDRDSDLQAGQSAGTQTVFIQSGQEALPLHSVPTSVECNLESAVSHILDKDFN